MCLPCLLACENIRFSWLLADGDVFLFLRAKRPHRRRARRNGCFRRLRVYIQDQSFNIFENDVMKLSVNEVKWTGLRGRSCATIEQVQVLKFAFGPEKFPGLSRNEVFSEINSIVTQS